MAVRLCIELSAGRGSESVEGSWRPGKEERRTFRVWVAIMVYSEGKTFKTE